MSDLAAFLLARVAEDEAVAREVLEKVKPGASLYGIPTSPIYVEDAEGSAASSFFDRDYCQGGYTITAARAEAECEVVRRIVALHSAVHVTTSNDGLDWDYQGCGVCVQPDDVDDGESWWPCETLKAHALPHADHPDFDPAWRL